MNAAAPIFAAAVLVALRRRPVRVPRVVRRPRPSAVAPKPRPAQPLRRGRGRKAKVGPVEARIELERRACIRSLAAFCKAAWHVIEPETPYQHNWHIDEICAHLEAVFWGHAAVTGPNAGNAIRNLVLNIPPRHMKSRIVSVFFPAWCWIHDPGRRFFFASYAQNLSDEHALDTMRLVRSEWYRTRFGPTGNPHFDAGGRHVSLGARQQTRHFITDRGGARQASSVMGKATGAGGDILVVDDPHNLLERESEVKMARVITWWAKAMASRGNNPKTFARIVVMQRIAEDDLSGYCIGQGYDTVILPARFEGQKAIGVLGHEDPREVEGEPLWANRFGDVELAMLEKDLDEDAAGQLQQRPAPAGGRVFKVNFLRRYSAAVRKALLARPDVVDEWVITVDTAVKGRAARKNAKRSYTVIAVWARRGSDAFLMDVWRKQVPFTEQVEGLREMAERWPMARPILIEDESNGPAIADQLANVVPGIELVPPRGDKDRRASAVAPFVKSGNVWVPANDVEPWVRAWVHEHELFPDASHNDQVDTTSMALDYLFIRGWTAPSEPRGGYMRPAREEDDPAILLARQRAAFDSTIRTARLDNPAGTTTTGRKQYTGRGYVPPMPDAGGGGGDDDDPFG